MRRSIALYRVGRVPFWAYRTPTAHGHLDYELAGIIEAYESPLTHSVCMVPDNIFMKNFYDIILFDKK